MPRVKAKRGGRAPDYVEFGSEEHLTLLNLRRVKPGEDVGELKCAPDPKKPDVAYTFIDPTAYANVQPWYVKIVLQQQVNEFLSEPPEMQSKDPSKPHYAPPMWPHPERPATGQTF